MTETVVPAAFTAVPRALDPENSEADGEVSFMRGLVYGQLFSIPCWIVIAGALLALLE